MAFCNRIGSFMRQNIASTGQVLTASMLNAVRSMSSSRLFVGGLYRDIGNESLKEAFSGFGNVVDARVMRHMDTGASKGFGFITFSSAEDANEAMSALDGKSVGGKTIRVNPADSRPGLGPGGGRRR